MKPLLALSAAGLLASAIATSPAKAAELNCNLKFNLTGWSAFYKHGTGSGTVSCSDGQSMRVNIRAKGGGLTFGKSRITDGKGEFTGLARIDQALGTYGSAEAHAGAVKSAKAMVVTKGNVSLALSGTGEGWDIGVAFGKFVISRAR